MKRIAIKMFLALGIIATVIVALDKSGLFKADQKNNHEKALWDGFYEFTEKNEVDVLLVGNSHLYTGINPNHLSCIMGANCFIVAASGAPILDTWFSLKEALKRCHPKVVVIETYGISDDRVRELKAGNLSNEYKSFESRKDIPLKLASTPVLFSSDNYLSAWSASIRNHDFIFRDPEQIKMNRKGENVSHKKSDLELGRFTRFTSGITAASDSLYDVLGPVVDGNSFRVNRESYDAVQKIVALCEKAGAVPVFLTLPMYHKHVANYGSWHTILSRVIGKDHPWLDLQEQYDYNLFDRECFEDTKKENQHLSAKGARICDYRLASFLNDNVNVAIPDRHLEESWRKMFCHESGYYEHYSIEPGDTRATELCRRVDLGGMLVYDCILYQNERGSMCYMKLDKRTPPELFRNGVLLNVHLKRESGDGAYAIVVRPVPGIDPKDFYLLVGSTDMKDITAAELVSMMRM